MEIKFEDLYMEIIKERNFSYKKTFFTRGYMYNFVVCSYSFGLRERTIEDIEKIIFLANCYVLEKYNRPMLKYKTYVYDNKIYLKFLSDLLRVMSYSDSNSAPMPTARDVKEGEKYNYKKVIERYSKLDGDELNRQINEIISQKRFAGKYIVYGKNESNIMRYFARNSAWIYSHWSSILKWMLGWLSVGMICAWIVYGVANFLTLFGFYIDALYTIGNEIIPLMFFSVVTIVPWCLMTLRAIQPTKYEIENGYLNE